MKKLALALIASTIVTGAANAAISTGFYLGAHVGYGNTSAKYSGTGVRGFGVVNGSADIGGNAADIGVMGGYGYVTGCLYVGGEIAYTFENTKINNNLFTGSGFGTATLKRNGYFNAALRGGYLFTPNTMMYIRLGGSWGQWKLNDPLNFGFNSANPANGSKNRLSFAPGVGMETAVHKNVYLRVEYNYEFGPSITATNPNPGFSAGASQVSNVRSQSGKVGLAYKF